MKKCISGKEIPRKVKEKLPAIPGRILRERACVFCPYDAGCYAGTHRCMLRVCAWEDGKEQFHPVLRQALPQFKKEMERSKEKYEKTLRNYQLLVSMVEKEDSQEKRENDECYRCPYAAAGPCIGICYKKLEEERRK